MSSAFLVESFLSKLYKKLTQNKKTCEDDSDLKLMNKIFVKV